MKSFLVLAILMQAVQCGYCQESIVDSLKNLLNNDLSDTARINRYIEIAGACYTKAGMPDTGLAYAKRAENLSEEIKWRRGIGLSIFYRTGYYYFKGNFPKCLSSAFTGLQILEEVKDTFQVTDCLRGIGFVYKTIEDYAHAITYSKKAIELARSIKDTAIMIDANLHIADSYLQLNNADSALIYYQERYQLINKSSFRSDNVTKSITYHGLARAYSALHDNDLAISYLNKSIKDGKNGGYIDPGIFKTYSEIKTEQHQYDSALHYAILSNHYDREYVNPVPLSYKQLAIAYEHFNKDSALKYFKLQYALNDSLFTSKSRSEIVSLTENESERQRYITENKRAALVSRQRNIQFTAIGIGLVTFIIFFLSYSRSIIANEKLIRFLGVLGLLIVFEFINLIIHPFVAHYTDDSPLFMLLIMVGIASLLIPLHHRIELWIRSKLVEKNKAIRLAAAKKTIAKLER